MIIMKKEFGSNYASITDVNFTANTVQVATAMRYNTKCARIL